MSLRFEDGYIGEIVAKVVAEIGAFKRPPSMLLLGGGQWRFARLVGKQANIERIMYADNRPAAMKAADGNKMFTVACEVHEPNAVCTGSKYDMIIMKNTLELVADKIAALDEYIVALYKTLKLNGIAIIVARLRPTLPLPSAMIEEWTKNVPDIEGVKAAVEKADLGIEVRIIPLTCKGTVDKAEWLEDVKMLPYGADVSAADVNAAIAKSMKGDKVELTDNLHVVVLAKNIKRVVRDEEGMINPQHMA